MGRSTPRCKKGQQQQGTMPRRGEGSLATTKKEFMPSENEEKQRGKHPCCHQARRVRWKRDGGKHRHGSETPWFVGMHETWAGYTGGRRRKQNHKGEHSSCCEKVKQLGHKFKIKATVKITEKRTNAIFDCGKEDRRQTTLK